MADEQNPEDTKIRLKGDGVKIETWDQLQNTSIAAICSGETMICNVVWSAYIETIEKPDWEFNPPSSEMLLERFFVIRANSHWEAEAKAGNVYAYFERYWTWYPGDGQFFLTDRKEPRTLLHPDNGSIYKEWLGRVGRWLCGEVDIEGARLVVPDEIVPWTRSIHNPNDFESEVLASVALHRIHLGRYYYLE